VISVQLFGNLSPAMEEADSSRVLGLSWRFRLLVEAATGPWKAQSAGIGSQRLLWQQEAKENRGSSFLSSVGGCYK
jgi:hypothetical protein